MLAEWFWASCEVAALPLSARWPPYSRLLCVSDGPGWSIDRDMQELSRIARRLGIAMLPSKLFRCIRRQSVFFGSHFHLLGGQWLERPHRFAVAYFHGTPGRGVARFDEAYRRLRQVHARIDRIQVSHMAMRDILLDAGVPEAKVFVIPIAVDLDALPMRTTESRRLARQALGLPASAVVVGSFQKDGVGWGAGLEPKLEKGPDVLLATLERMQTRVPELFVLLTGPARGYIKAGLERLRIPYRHVWLGRYADIARCYHAIDVYVVSSRDEGGPKAVLESMATGVPLVTTRVGQAADLVEHGTTGWVTDVADADALASWAVHAVTDSAGAACVVERARKVAEANTYVAQTGLWKDFMTGFVGLPMCS
jgi:glycosyltransferase involved in cell wall biosynthesis